MNSNETGKAFFIVMIRDQFWLSRWNTLRFKRYVVLRDKRRTSNVQRWTSNNDAAALRNLISFVFNNPISSLEWLFLFLHLFPFNIRCWAFDVRCSFFSNKPATVTRFINNSALMASCPQRSALCSIPNSLAFFPTSAFRLPWPRPIKRKSYFTQH